MTSMLSPSQRYAAGALFGLALHEAQVHQTRPLGGDGASPTTDRISTDNNTGSVSAGHPLWINESAGLLRPIFRFLEIDSNAWTGLEEIAGSSPAKQHIGAFLSLLSEESSDTSSDMKDNEVALSKAIDSVAQNMEATLSDSESKTELHRFSLGARVVFKCLQFLAETEHNAELVETIVLLGAPIAMKDENWEAARKVVSGRFVNVYSVNDWMLGVAFRVSLLTQGLAGIQPIDVPGIENGRIHYLYII